MNPNPRALRILCYGDSNTWGARPDGGGRFPADQRWTGQLQRLLGEGCEIIEEGLGGRTTDVDRGPDFARDGRRFLEPCLESHHPLDAVVLALGTNDLKMEFNRSAEDIARGLTSLAKGVKAKAETSLGKETAVLLVSPPAIDEAQPGFNDWYVTLFNAQSLREAKRLAPLVKAVAQKTGCLFVDAAPIAFPGHDGLHLTADAHHALAQAIATELKRASEPRGLARLYKLLRGR